ncbi:GNAT family N-acetyltransferase [Skermania sp. ID1734]|uniref:GNAT family N-acetyltransferase n=1 Tax=Skermania sp. ID1734 TaxID=2597516 RepID=UPI002102F979|nr:GNAT family N-acetyltransferase [Skermania sp. ID1734]
MSVEQSGVVTVRTARSEDGAAIGQLITDVYVGGGFIPANQPYAATLADTAARAAAAEILVAELDGAIVGTVTIARPGSAYAPLARPDELEFRMLAVDTSVRGGGIGTMLVRRVLEVARSESYAAVVISTMETMVDAQRLYRKLGFARVPERDWDVVPGVRLPVLAIAVNA